MTEPTSSPTGCGHPGRLRALRSYGILDTPAEEAFDGIARLAAHVCGTPMAIINFLDEDRQWFKSVVGVEVRETPLDLSICADAIRQSGLFVIRDLSTDERFADNPWVVGEPHLRFYAGVPLETADGFALGTLCVLDRVVRDLEPAQADALRTLACQVMAQLELRREIAAQSLIREDLRRGRDAAESINRALAESEERHRCIAELTSDYAVSARVGDDGQIILDEATGGFAKVTGYTPGELTARGGWPTLVDPEDLPGVHASIARMLTGVTAGGEIRIIARSGEQRWVHYLGRGVRDAQSGRIVRLHVASQDITDRKRAEATIAEQLRLADYGRDIGFALSESPDLGTMLNRCAVATIRHLDGALARIWTLDPNADMLVLRASAGEYSHLDGPHGRIPIGKDKVGRVALDRAPQLTNGVVGDPHISSQDWAVREGMVAFAGYPLLVEGRLVGVLAMFARHALSEATLAAMDSVSRGIALGIERKLAAEAAAENQAWLATTLSSIGDAVIATDDLGRVRFMNPIAEALTGWSGREATGLPMDEIVRIVDEQTRQPAEHPVVRVLRDGVVVEAAGQTVLIARDGTETPIEAGAAPIRGEVTPVVGVVLVFRDVTRERAAQRLVHESTELYRTLIEVSPQVIWYGRGDGYITYCNQWWFDYTGQTMAQSEGHGWAEAIHPDHRERVRQIWLEAAARGGDYEVEIPFRRAADGTYRWHLATGRPLRDETGEVVKWVGVAVDIDDRRRAEDERRESEDRLRFALDATGIGHWDLDLATDTTTRSLRHDRIFGYDKPPAHWGYDTFLGRHVHPEDRPAVDASFREANANGRDWEFECRIHRTDGVERWIWAKAGVYLSAGGRPLRMLGLVMDITERRLMEEELRASKEEAEAANRAKTQFLAVLSHELRTPLNPILLATSSMLEQADDPKELRPTLEMIRQNVNLQARLIDDLLDVMRIVRGKMPLHWELADCHRLIEQAVQVCRSDVLGHDLRLKFEPGAAHCHVNADPARLQQVFWNLIRNAVKFTPEGGRVTIRTYNLTDPEQPPGLIAIEVSDTGIGIESDVLPVVFDPFQQGETTITRKFGGLGLGLAICKGIVDAHGGSIAAESRGKDRGTTFRVTLRALPEPVAEPDGLPASSPSVGHAPPSSVHMLLVEDEPATLRLMERLLRGLGYDVAAARSVSEAVALFDAGHFDMIVSDIGLPDATGLDLMRYAVNLRGPIPAIALTGYGMEEDIRRSREAGFTAHLTKPIDFVKLEAMIRQVLASRR